MGKTKVKSVSELVPHNVQVYIRADLIFDNEIHDALFQLASAIEKIRCIGDARITDIKVDRG